MAASLIEAELESSRPRWLERLVVKSPRDWLVLYGVWSLPVLAMATTDYLSQSDSITRPWPFFVAAHTPYWFFYASLCPLIYRLVRRFPITGAHANWSIALIVHLTFGLAASVIATALVFFWLGVLVDRPLTVTAFVQRFVSGGSAIAYQVMNLVVYSLAVAALSVIANARWRRHAERRRTILELHATQLESQLTSARLQMLHLQLNPHFLFNALNSIATLVQIGDNDDAYRAIGLLSAFLRRTLEQSDDALVPLGEELESVQRYLELERIRFADRIETKYNVGENYSGIAVPAFILQPLVENAIKHAVARSTDPVEIKLAATSRGGWLRLDISDTGPGLAATNDARTGVGLANVRERLSLHYGSKAQFELLGNSPHGTVARLTLPVTPIPTSEKKGAINR